MGTYLQLDDHQRNEFDEGVEAMPMAGRETVREYMTSWELEGLRTLLTRPVENRFGSLHPDDRQLLEQLDPEDLEQLAETVLDAPDYSAGQARLRAVKRA